MMELLHQVMKGDLIKPDTHAGGSRRALKRPPSLSQSTGGRNVQSIIQLYERCSSVQEEGKHDTESAMDVRRSPPMAKNQKPVEASPKRAVPLVQLPGESPVHGVLDDAVVKCPAQPPESKADSSTEDVRRVKRKSLSIHKEIVQAIDAASHAIADSLDRIHSANLLSAEDIRKAQEDLFYTEFNYLKKRDRRVFHNQKNLINSINALTEIITTGLKKNASAGDASKEIVGDGDED